MILAPVGTTRKGLIERGYFGIRVPKIREQHIMFHKDTSRN
jgi:hypothetical protein